MKAPVRVTVTGAAGQIGYALLFRIASGSMLGDDQPVILQLLDITPAMDALGGVKMELDDCAFPLLADVICTDDPEVAFKDCDYALLVGARPRGPGMERKDLLEANAAIENDPMEIMDWINLFAFAVSEENAAGGQVVTSPTNGAAGVIPAVLMYYHRFIKEPDTKQLKDFLAVSGAIGILYKTNASMSGAEVGCQGEVGVSSSMAAAGLTALRGGSNEQICIAAEIAMEHSLGMTCDPIGGLVQVPCIERNAMGAMKAINASRMALKRTSKCLISLDKVIETMYQTGKDMNKKYRETSLGGLAVIHMAPPCE